MDNNNKDDLQPQGMPLPKDAKIWLARECGPFRLMASAQGAAKYLAEHAPIRTEKQWLAWIYNNAKPSRPVNYRLPFNKRLNRTHYYFEDLDRVARIELYLANKAPTLSPEDQQWIAAHPDTTSET